MQNVGLALLACRFPLTLSLSPKNSDHGDSLRHALSFRIIWGEGTEIVHLLNLRVGLRRVLKLPLVNSGLMDHEKRYGRKEPQNVEIPWLPVVAAATARARGI
jgi:hypothetical protein